jgi:hypothetical protein
MFQILLLILKIIGVILLVFIGLLLLGLLAGLLIPVRYKIYADLSEEINLDGSISWLLHLLYLRIFIKDKKLHFRLRILGIRVFDSLHRDNRKKRNNVKLNRKKCNNSKQNREKRDCAEKQRIRSENEDHDNIKHDIKNETVVNNKKIASDFINHTENDAENTKEESTKSSKRCILKKLLIKIRDLKAKAAAFFGKVRSRVKNLKKKLFQIIQKGSLILEFLNDEMNQQGLKVTCSSLMRMMKHMLPKKLEANLVFGTGNPCSTGQILGVVGLIYSFYGDKLNIIPDFEEKRLEGTFKVVGRIRLITILIIAIKLIFNRRFKQLRNNWKTVKEAL